LERIHAARYRNSILTDKTYTYDYNYDMEVENKHTFKACVCVGAFVQSYANYHISFVQ